MELVVSIANQPPGSDQTLSTARWFLEIGRNVLN